AVWEVVEFRDRSKAAAAVIETKSMGFTIPGGDPRQAVAAYVSARKISEATYPALAGLVQEIGKQVDQYGSIAKVPAEAVGNTRNDRYPASAAIRFPLKAKQKDLSSEDVPPLNPSKKS